MSKSKLQRKFGGQSHQIDANTLITSLIHYTAVIAEINNEMGNGSRNIRVGVNALKEGSFIIDLEVVENVKTIFSNNTVQYVAGIVTVFGGVVSLYKKFKGKPIPKDIKVDLDINKDIKITINNVTNIYNNRTVRESISKSIENVISDSPVESIEFIADEFNHIEIERESFKDLVYDDFASEEIRPEEIEEFVDAQLVITGLKFEMGGKWDFIYNGFKISMVVKDDALMQAINNGARLGKGDIISVKMKIIKRYNAKFRTYENKGYRIVEFYQHIPSINPKQVKLFNEQSTTN